MGLDELCGFYVPWNLGCLCQQGPGVGALEQFSVRYCFSAGCGISHLAGGTLSIADNLANGRCSDCGLREELARKHPFDEQAQAAVRKAISKLGDAEVRFLAWLLTVDRPGQAQVQGQGFRGEPESILEKTSTLLIGFESIRPGNGLMEMDRIYHVNSKSEQTIKNVLFPLTKG